ncbi:MAG: molecular chaperone DnaJ [Eubacteriales bacterium]|jgi:molecular chaperone DnaJ
MAEEKRDFYEVLGVDKSATQDEIKKAYIKLAKKHHPDMNPDDENAEHKFKEVNEAYSILSDPDKRQKYDTFGMAGVDPSAGGGYGEGGGFGGFDFSDILNDFFGGGSYSYSSSSSRRASMPIDGDDIYVRQTITFEEAAFGVTKNISYNRIIKCPECGATGAAKGTKPEECPACGGSGQVRTTQRTILGSMSTVKTCDSCRGTGKVIKNPCPNCSGKGYIKINNKVDANIPAGIDDGQKYVMRGYGNDGRNGGSTGDLVIEISVKEHNIFRRNGSDLYCEIPITFTEAALGAQIKVPTLEGTELYTIPEGTQTGTQFVLKNMGIQVVNSNRRGDLYFRVTVEVPKNLSSAQKELLCKFAESCDDRNNAKSKAFFDKLFRRGKD